MQDSARLASINIAQNHHTENKLGNSESSTMRLKHNTAEEGENNEAYLAFSGRSAS
jgi:hypothetical protein